MAMMAATSGKQSVRAIMAWALLALGVLVAVPGVHAQTSTSVEMVTLTPAPESTSTSSASSPTMTLQCWRLTTIAGEPASIVVDPKSASVSGAECWEVYPIGGGTASVPYTVTAPDFAPTSDQTTASANAAADTVSTSSNNRAIKVIMPAIIGSLVGFILLVIATLWFLRLRMRRKSEASRARRWAERNSVSWAMKESPVQKVEQSDGEIEVGPRQPAPYTFATRF